MNFSSSVTGADKVAKVLANLPAKTRSAAGRKALREGAKVVKAEASANVKKITSESKVATGTLARGLAVYGMKKLRGMLRTGVMVRKGLVHKRIIKGSPVRVGLYASVLEYGKRNQPPRSWLRKAADDKSGQVYAKIREELAKNIDKAIEESK